MQKIIISGFVGKDPEEKFTPKGNKLTSFSVAVSSISKGEKITTWYNINFWDTTCANVLKYIKKGNGVTVIGDLRPPTSYQNKEGKLSIDLTISAQSISFLPSNNRTESDTLSTNKTESDPFSTKTIEPKEKDENIEKIYKDERFL